MRGVPLDFLFAFVVDTTAGGVAGVYAQTVRRQRIPAPFWSGDFARFDSCLVSVTSWHVSDLFADLFDDLFADLYDDQFC